MATHRRGLRPAQWPIRDLLGEQRAGVGGLRDPRLYAAVGGLLACGAAATVAFTAGDGGPGRGGMPGPMALPAPATVVPAPADPGPDPASDPASDPAPDPAPSGTAPARAGARAQGGAPASGASRAPRSGRLPQAWRPGGKSAARPTSVTVVRRDAAARALADRVAAELAKVQERPCRDGKALGLLVVPQQREGDAALVKRVRTDVPCASADRGGARHRARRSGDDDRKRSDAGRAERDEKAAKRVERDRDDDRADDRKRDERDHDDHESKQDDDRDRHRHGKDDDRDRHRHGKDDDRHRHRHGKDDDRDRGDGKAGDGKHRDGRAPSTRTAAGAPAMASLATSGRAGRSTGLTVRSIDRGAVLAALAELDRPTTSRG